MSVKIPKDATHMRDIGPDKAKVFYKVVPSIGGTRVFYWATGKWFRSTRSVEQLTPVPPPSK